MKPEPELCVTTKEAAARLRTSARTVRRLIKEHKLPRLEGTKNCLIPVAALNSFVQGAMSITMFERIDVIETESHFAHDRACLYIKDHAAEFLQCVKPASEGYAAISVETGWPIEQEAGSVAAWVDLLITGDDIALPKRYREEHLRRYPPPNTPPMMKWPSPQALFVEVITWRQPVGEILRKLRHQRVVWNAADQANYWRHYQLYDGDAHYRPVFENVVLVIAPVYQVTVDERREFTDAKIVIVELKNVNGNLGNLSLSRDV